MFFGGAEIGNESQLASVQILPNSWVSPFAESLIKKPLTRASSGRSTRDYPFMISDHKHNYNYSIAMHPNRKGDRVVRRGRPTVVSLPREYIASKIKTL
jgi:hypothetical protein